MKTTTNNIQTFVELYQNFKLFNPLYNFNWFETKPLNNKELFLLNIYIDNKLLFHSSQYIGQRSAKIFKEDASGMESSLIYRLISYRYIPISMLKKLLNSYFDQERIQKHKVFLLNKIDYRLHLIDSMTFKYLFEITNFLTL